MSGDTVLLLDFDPNSTLCSRVCDSLKSVLSRGVRIQQESITFSKHQESTDSRLRDAEVKRILKRVNPSLAFLALPGFSTNNSLQSISSLFQILRLPTIVALEKGAPEEMLRLLEFGATDFIIPPFSPLNILPRVWRWLDQVRGRNELTNSLKRKLGLKQLIGESPAFVAEVNRIPLVASSDVTVLLLGETGTGKELFARAIHYLGPRASGPFVPVNCGAIPSELVENELFGHERGAFTNATNSKQGLVAEAHGGTIFLDEIDCLPLMAQVKLLRFIQEREYRPLGSTRTHHAELRIIAASNADLRLAVKEGKVRSDLYYRLNTIPFMLPALRERRDDIPLLARRFLSKYASEVNKQFVGFSSDALQTLMAHDWPGNVRELEHVIERVAVLAEGPIVHRSDVLLNHDVDQADCSFRVAKTRVIDQFEKNYISGLLAAHDGNITRAAQSARKNRRAFYELMRKHNLDRRGSRSE